MRGPVRVVYDCYCERCRRFSGHHLAATAADPRHVSVHGADLVNWFSPDPTVEYGSCSRCGSSLFWRSRDLPDHVSIAAGVLDQPTGLRTTQAWFVSEAGDYHQRCGGIAEFDRDGPR